MAGMTPQMFYNMFKSHEWDDARGSGDGRYADKYGGGGWDDARGLGDGEYDAKYGGDEWDDAAQEPSDT